MSDPIDIKTKKIIPSVKIEKFDKSLVLENLDLIGNKNYAKNQKSHYG